VYATLRAVEQVVERSTDAVALLAGQASEARLEYVNPAFEELLGHPVDLRAEGPRLTVADLPPGLSAILAQDRGDEGRREHRYHTAEGDEVVVEAEIKATSIDGKPARLAILRDVTALKRLEHIAAASEVSESVGYVFAGIRHELGNPLNSIKAVLSLLVEPEVDLPRERSLHFLRRAMGEVLRMETLLDQLRTFNEHEIVHLSPISIRAFLERFARLVRSDCSARGASLELDIPSDAQVGADNRLLHQILILLLTNALDAVDGAAERKLRLAVHANARNVRVVLTDSGAGMTSAQLAGLL